MRVTLVNVHASPEQVGDFIDATRRNHGASVKETE